MQRGDWAGMNDGEKDACESLKNSKSSSENEISAAGMTVVKRIELRKRHRLNKSHKYRNCDFILDSAAHFERL